MFRYLRVKKQPERISPEPQALTAEQLSQDASLPIALRQINGLPENAKKRVYRTLLPPSLLVQHSIDPIHWQGPSSDGNVVLKAEPQSGIVNISARTDSASTDVFLCIELADNAFNSVDLTLLLLNDPESPRYSTDYDERGEPTLFGTLHRNLDEEQRAMVAGLAPGQTRSSLGASRLVLQQLDAFIAAIGQRAVFLEPLTYASAWVFERRGFAYVRGHKLMDDIHSEFQPGGRLHQALDGSTPFRQPGMDSTVRGRAWAIHDGILDVLGERWNGLRMVKQAGRHAGVETFPGAVY